MRSLTNFAERGSPLWIQNSQFQNEVLAFSWQNKAHGSLQGLGAKVKVTLSRSCWPWAPHAPEVSATLNLAALAPVLAADLSQVTQGPNFLLGNKEFHHCFPVGLFCGHPATIYDGPIYFLLFYNYYHHHTVIL